MGNKPSTLHLWTLLVTTLITSAAQAEIGSVYRPKIDYLEKEVEYQYLSRQSGTDLQSLSLGYSWHPRLSAELYIYSEQLTHNNRKIKGIEAELQWQLTEQGEYSADWGIIFEVNRSRDISGYEFAMGLIWEKTLSRYWIGTINTFLEYEFGSDIDNEWETALRAQLRYRKSSLFEPALELFLDDQDKAFGPVWLGQIRLAPRHHLNWQLGAYWGLDDATPNRQVRLSLEWEFL